MQSKIRLGISSCLMGEKVRYDGAHKFNPFLVNTLGEYVDYVPVCPEYECGLGIPREAMRLEGDPDAPRLMTNRTKVDLTKRMLAWCRKRVGELEKEDLQGFIFKSRSPSSGMERVKVYNDKGMPVQKGVGLFARAFMDHFPLIPVEEDGRLNDPGLRENFIERIFAFRDWRETVKGGKTRANLIGFHSRYKLLLLSHSEKHVREMGRLVAAAKEYSPAALYAKYLELFSAGLKLKATVKKNVNVLQHIMGFFKTLLSADEKQELLEVIEQYKQRYIPLIGPITLLNHYVRKYEPAYLLDQVFLRPHPVELALRNHV